MAKKDQHSPMRRLFACALPYKWILAAGILAGVVTGGSTFGVLANIDGVMKPLQGGLQNCKSCNEEIDLSPAMCPKCGKSVLGRSKQQEAPDLTTWVGRTKARINRLAELAEKFDPKRYLAKRMGIEDDLDAERVSFKLMIILAGGLALLLILKTAAQVTNRFCMRLVGVKVVRDVRNRLFEHLQKQSLKFYGQSDVGELISRVNNDTLIIEGAVSGTIADLTRAPIQILFVMTFLVWKTIELEIYELWLFLLIVAPLIMIPMVFFSKKIRQYVRRSLQKISDLNSRMHEVFTGIRVVKAFNTEKQEVRQFENINARYIKQLIRALRAELSITVVLEAMKMTLACVIIVYCYFAQLQLVDLSQLMLAAMLLYEPAKRLTKVNTELQRSSAAASRIFELMDVDMEIKEIANPTPITAFKDAVVFENVNFSYDRDRPLLRNINFQMKKGEVVAFVGTAGCGKSTISNILARFYEPDSGRVTIDGVDLCQVELKSLRNLIGVVTQDTILFNDTIANNIAYGDEQVDMERVLDAAKRAHAHEFITEREDGYDTVVGEKGFMLSGGQKQRIAIARALYKNPAILILDEATSALDSVTEQLVQKALNELMKERTVFAIAHRFSTIRHANQIFVLDAGQIVEQGTHDELLAEGGQYLTMTQIQNSDS